MHILVTRPEPDASELKVPLEAMGHTVTVEPLLQIELMRIESNAFEGAQAVVATSRNGLRALAESPARPAALKRPIFTVGPGTAELARALGFARLTEGAGTARDLVPIIAGHLQPKAGSVIHLAGETLAFDLAVALENQGIAARKIVVYRAHPAKTLTVQTTQLMGEGALDAVILMSPRTAAVFAQLVAAAGQKDGARRLTYLCLSQAVAQSLHSLGPVRNAVAAKPNSSEMLSLVGRVATRPPGV
jgi:uroporphyrinogen-III synthase